MQNIPDFKVDSWVREYGPIATTLLHGSNASPLSLRDLQRLAPELGPGPIDLDLKLSYSSSRGNPQLRQRIAEIHSSDTVTVEANDVIVTPGSILANYVALTTVCSPGDHVICQYPTYGQLYLIPRSIGADVSLWKMREEHGWSLSTDELVALIKPNTKAIILNTPNNPTGGIISQDQIDTIIEIAHERNITILSDEVFRPLFYSNGPQPAPVVSLGYTNSVSTGSLSKAYGLPGLRLGWVVTKNTELREKILRARDYTTINVARLDEDVGAYALTSPLRERVLERNIALFKESISLVEDFISVHKERCRWVKPAGGGTAWVRVLTNNGTPIDDEPFCAKLAKEGQATFLPGSHTFGETDAGDFKGYIRVALGDPEKVKAGLPILEKFLHNY